VPALYVLQGPDKGKTFHTSSKRLTLGRRARGGGALTDHSISRKHAELREQDGDWFLEDFQSSNGTYINGERIYEQTVVHAGDQIRVGSTLLLFTSDEISTQMGDPRDDMVTLEAEDSNFDSSILASASAGDQSVILASPETYEAVHAWNIMYQLAETIGTVTSVPDFLERMVDIIFNHLQVERVFVLMRGDDDELRPQIVRYRGRKRDRTDRIVTSRHVVSHVMSTKEGVLCANARTDTRFGGDQKDASIHRLGLRSVMCVPILTHDEATGVIHLDCSMAYHTYTQQQLLLATAIGKMAGMAIENARLIESRVANERLAAVGETVAHLSHNIRNILQGMRSGADVIDLALKKENLQTVQTGWQIVQRNLDRTFRLASNMLTFSKERQPNIELAQLNQLIDEVVSLVAAQLDDRGIRCVTQLDDLPPIPLDVDGMHQAITNIVVNAIEACPKDGGQITISTSFDESESDVVCAITDNGPGIPEPLQESIFNPFHSTKGHGGTGLGLSACKKIIDELGGTISLNSSPQGTTFELRLSTTHPGLADSDETHGHGQ
jgi:two-component system, NtrC family, sensor kinase